MKKYNINDIKTQSGDSFAKDAVIIFGNKGNIWQGKVLEKCTDDSNEFSRIEFNLPL